MRIGSTSLWRRRTLKIEQRRKAKFSKLRLIMSIFYLVHSIFFLKIRSTGTANIPERQSQRARTQMF